MTGLAEVMEDTAIAKGTQALGGREAFRLSPEIVVLSGPKGARAEGIRTLRTHIMAKHVGDGRRGLAVCAASGGVGATFTAVNLAVAAAQIGVKTLLVDADLRRPQVASFIEPEASAQGLTQYLQAEGSDPSEYIQHDVLDSLSVLQAGGAPANAQELIAGERFSGLVQRCLRDYELTIVDTPPAGSCADARRISTVVGYSLIVAQRHHTFINDIKVLAGQLREDGAQVIGTVMNET